MRVHSLHKCAKFFWFSSVNDKIIDNLHRWGVFSKIFDDPWPYRLNYWRDPKKFAWWNDGTDHLCHLAKFGWNQATHVGVRGWSVMLITIYQQDLPEGQLCRYCSITITITIIITLLLTGRFLGFSPHSGDTLHRSRWNLAICPLLPAKFHLDRFIWVCLRSLKLKKWNFTNIIAPKGRVPCTILTKFTGFMRVLTLHNFAKFHLARFSSINDKIISNLPRWGRFQPKFRRHLAAKLLMGPKKYGDKIMARTTSYHHANFGGNQTTLVGVRGRSVMFFTFYVRQLCWST